MERTLERRLANRILLLISNPIPYSAKFKSLKIHCSIVNPRREYNVSLVLVCISNNQVCVCVCVCVCVMYPVLLMNSTKKSKKI